MFYYYAITNNGTKLYRLTQKQQTRFLKLFPKWESDRHTHEERHAALEYIEAKGKQLGLCDACAY